MRRIIYDGDSFYELDEDCLKKKEEERQKEIAGQKKHSTETVPLKKDNAKNVRQAGRSTAKR